LARGDATASGGKQRGGAGARPEEKSDAQFYDSTIKGQVGRGKSVVIGEVAGPNVRGRVGQRVQLPADAAETRDADPQSAERLPRSARDQAKQYFDLLRGVEGAEPER
jgi:hypothetical protein